MSFRVADVPKLFLNDTLVPDIFIADYLPTLGSAALRVYLMGLFYKNAEAKVDSRPVRQALGLSKEDLKAALLELAGRELVAIELDFSAFTLIDLKRQLLDRYYRRVTSQPMGEQVNRPAKTKEQSSLIKSISDTYFNGLMGAAWYQAIDSWFDQYGLEPAVVYQMFDDASKRNVLNGPNYLNKVAEDYARHGVKTFMELTRYKEENQRLRQLAQRIGKKLNKRITEYDFKLVEKWSTEYGYDFDIIELALRNAVRLAEPNLNYFDAIIASWHEAGIKTVAEALRVEENQQRVQEKKRRGGSGSKLDREVQRRYDEDYLNRFYDIAGNAMTDDTQGSGQ